MDPFALVVLCLLVAAMVTAGAKKKRKPFLAWVVDLAEPKKRGKKSKRRR